MSETIEENVTEAESSVAPSIVASLIAIGKLIRAMVGLKLAEIDLHPGQDELLLALDIRKPRPVSELALVLKVRPSTVSKMLDRLVDKDLLQRVAGTGDARLTFVQITRKGVAKVKRIVEVREALDAELIGALEASSLATTPADVEALSQIVALRLRRLR